MDRVLSAIFVAGIFAVCNATSPISASTQNLSMLVGWPLVSLMGLAHLQRRATPAVDASLSIGALACFYFHLREQRAIENTAVFATGWLVILLVWAVALIRSGYFSSTSASYKEMVAVWKSALRP